MAASKVAGVKPSILPVSSAGNASTIAELKDKATSLEKNFISTQSQRIGFAIVES
jgi:hypothetical protein